MYAARNGHIATAVELARLGANVNARDNVRGPRLHLHVSAAVTARVLSRCVAAVEEIRS